MKNILYVILLTGLSIALFSCAKKSDTSSTATTTTELEGTWIASCFESGSLYKLITITVTGTDYIRKLEYHSDSSCNSDYSMWENTFSFLAIGDNATYSDGGKGHLFSKNVVSVKYTPQDAANVSSKNSSSYCGYSDWSINTAKDVTGKTCGSSAQLTANITLLGLYKLVGNNLQLGDFSSQTYPSSVNSLIYVRQ